MMFNPVLLALAAGAGALGTLIGGMEAFILYGFVLIVQTVLASADLIDTMIFDEIDSGISGRTAQALSEKLSIVAKDKQVICITHLPQVAAMADSHFLIEKHVEGTKTISSISVMSYDDRVIELSRMLAGSSITESVTNNAKELLDYATSYKNS